MNGIAFMKKNQQKIHGSGVDKKSRSVTPKALNEVVGKDAVRTHTGIGELDRVLDRKAHV